MDTLKYRIDYTVDIATAISNLKKCGLTENQKKLISIIENANGILQIDVEKN